MDDESLALLLQPGDHFRVLAHDVLIFGHVRGGAGQVLATTLCEVLVPLIAREVTDPSAVFQLLPLPGYVIVHESMQFIAPSLQPPLLVRDLGVEETKAVY